METGMNRVLRWMILPLVALLLADAHADALDSSAPALAPLNPDFIVYRDHAAELPARQAQALQAEAEDEHALGYLPEPIDMSHLQGQRSVLSIEQLGLPLSYDLRSLGKVTPVRNQGNCGSCWAFATMGSAESNLLPAEARDLSENNLKNMAGFLWGPCEGGNASMATAYLARWSGSVYESDDPYNASSGISPSGLSARKHYQEVDFIPGRGGSLDNDAIKQAIMKYGAVMTSYYAEHGNISIYQPTTHAYYYTGSNASNHAVTIVGWDDNFPRTSFATTPPGDGAFIIKNSWGTNWGENGFFYMSYYDSRMGVSGNSVFRQPDAATNYSRIYQYDPLGNTSNIGYTSSTGWFANVFTASAGEYLSAVSFYARSLNSTYEIYIYTNSASGPTSGTLSGTTTGTVAEAGYHTLQLADPVMLTNGQKFSIVAKLTTPGFNFPIPLEYPVSGYAAATANPGESYVSSTGTTWSDIASYYANANVCLKGFTSPASRIINGITINGSPFVTESSSAAYAASASWSDGTTSPVTATWSITPTSYASISAGGLLTVSALPGDQTVAVTASYLSGGVTNTTTKNVTFVKYTGDCDIDGKNAVNIADALYALRIAVGIAPETASVISHGDMNRNGEIDISDALFILKKVVGLL